MSLILDVPYSEKDEAKALGAKWDPQKKKWFVADSTEYIKFIRWIPGVLEDTNIILDHFYIIEGYKQCYRCHRPTKVISFGVDEYLSFVLDEDEDENDIALEWSENIIRITPFIENLPYNFLDYIKNVYGFYQDYSSSINSYYYANHCTHCGAIQGMHYLFFEPTSPFFINDVNSIKNLTIYKFSLEYDLITPLELSYGTYDHLIKKYAKIHHILGIV